MTKKKLKKISEKDLGINSYVRCDKPYMLDERTDYFLEKRVDDKHGKKYFIDIVHHKGWPEKKLQDSFVINVQFKYLGRMRGFINFQIHWFDPDDLSLAEAMIDRVWEACGKPYYERWGE